MREIYVPRGPSISIAVVRLLWTVVRQSFMIEWNCDECYKWSIKESIMSGFDWTDFGGGHVEQRLNGEMTGNSRMTSAMAQCKACLMRRRSQWASLKHEHTSWLGLWIKKKYIFNATAEEIWAELESNQNQHHPRICSDSSCSNRCYFHFVWRRYGLKLKWDHLIYCCAYDLYYYYY